MGEAVVITIHIEVEPDVDMSAFQIVTGVVLEALHECSLFPTSLTVEAAQSGRDQRPV